MTNAMERILPIGREWRRRDELHGGRIPLGDLADGGTSHLVGSAIVGVLAAFAGLAFLGAGGNWSGGLTLAGAVLLGTGGLVLLLLRRRVGAVEEDSARRAIEDMVAAWPHPAVLLDREGKPRLVNHAHRQCFAAARAHHGAAIDREIRDREGRPYRCTAVPCAAGTILGYLPVPTEPAAAGSPVPWNALGETLAALDIGLAVVGADDQLRCLNRWLRDRLALEAEETPPRDLAAALLDPAQERITLPGGVEAEKHLVADRGGERLLLVRPVGSAEIDGLGLETAQWRTLFDTAPLGLAIVTSEGRLLAFNKPFRRFAPNRNPRQGDSLVDYVAGEDGVEIAKRLDRIFAGEPPAAPLDVSFNTHPARTGQVVFSRLPGDSPRRALVHLIDTTKHKSLERQFVQAQKMQAVGQLAGGVAHDFNNLLTAIIGFCDLLLVRHGPGDQSFSDIMQIKQNANRAANLVRQLLAFSRQQTMRPKVLVVTDVLADLSNLLRRLIGETIELKMIHGRDLGPVKVDQGQLEQVIINLAVNARDAMPDGGTLTIRTKSVGPDDRLVQHYSVMPAGHYVLIEVTDTGEGIAPENLNKIFEPFFTTKSVGKGTGLGLSTVYGIIKQTGGFIFVESAPGEGATFRVYLPVHAEAASEEKAAAAPQATDLTGRGTILLVEDEDAVRMFAARALTNKGYRVLEAGSGEEALALVRENAAEIDLLISDVVMPNMDGQTLVAEAKRIRPDLRVIFISGYAEDVFKRGGGELTGDAAFLPKPFSLKQLAESVKAALG